MLNKALKIVKQYHNLNQTQLAGKLSLSTSYLSELESGRKEPTLDILDRYAKLFNMPLSSLLVFSETLDGTHSQSKARAFFSKKMLRILEWIAAQNGQTDPKKHAEEL